ncbi:hypothetical protein GCM10027578_01210 [Spirosoma luteolum]
MRLLLLSFLCCAALTSYAQTDTTRRPAPARSQTQPVVPPGVDSPLSAPGTLMQSPPNPGASAEPTTPSGKRRRTSPPASPRAFGVSVPLGKPKRDTLR